MKRYGILLALLMALILAFTLMNGCSTPKKATTEEMTKPTDPRDPRKRNWPGRGPSRMPGNGPCVSRPSGTRRLVTGGA